MALPLVLPPTVLGFYLLVALGPDGPGGWLAGLWGARTLAFTFERPGDRLGALLDAVRRAADPQRLRGHRRAAAGGRGDAAGLAARRVLDRRACRWRGPGLLTGAVLGFAHTVGEFGVVLMIGGNIPGQTKVLSVAIYDYVETLAVARRPTSWRPAWWSSPSS